MSKIEAQAVVVGAGISGLVAALRLAEQGVRALVLERGNDERYLCNTRIAGGAYHVAHRDVVEPAERMAQAIAARTGTSARPDLIAALANDIGPATQWLKAKGAKFIRAGHEPYRQHTLAPPIAMNSRTYWEGRGGDALLRTLEAELRKHGVTLQRGVRARRLLMSGGAVVGLVAEQGGTAVEIASGSVVICDGGYQSNMDLLREFISPAPEKLMQRNARSGLGDGLVMAREAGAQLVGLNRFYGHVLAQDAMTREELSPFPMMDLVCAAGIVVDRSGRRFMDEGLGGVTMANAIAAQPDPLGATVIFDAEIWNNGPGREYYIPANPTLVTRGGTLLTASNARELAALVGVPGDALEQSVAQHNAAIASGEPAPGPKRTTGTYKAWPIRATPLHAVRLCSGITYTMGGIAIDGDARVLRPDESTIPGLYAAGCAAGGLEGGGDTEQVAYLGGLTRATVFALRAANDIATRRRVS